MKLARHLQEKIWSLAKALAVGESGIAAGSLTWTRQFLWDLGVREEMRRPECGKRLPAREVKAKPVSVC